MHEEHPHPAKGPDVWLPLWLAWRGAGEKTVRCFSEAHGESTRSNGHR